MPEIEIRPALASDIPALIALDHNYFSDHIWQLEISTNMEETPMIQKGYGIQFRQVRLPRQVRVEYPRDPRALTDTWKQRSIAPAALLVAILEGEPIGYTSLAPAAYASLASPLSMWITDLVVSRPLRHRGIGSALALAAMEWADHMESQNLIVEMQPKNYPAIQLAQKLGFEFCGYNDRHYAQNEIGIFFGKLLR